MWIGKAKLSANPIYHVIAAAIYGQLGRREEAEAERQWFAKAAPEILTELPKVIRMRSIRPKDETHLLDGLAKAGLISLESGKQQG